MSETQEISVKKEQEANVAADPSKVVADALKDFTGAPTKEQIDSWKSQHGEVFCSGFSETELFIWRPIKRAEFVNLQAQITSAEKPVSALSAEELVVQMCLLWSSTLGEKALTIKAGSLSSLHEQIMSNSNFMDPRIAAAMIIKL